MAKRSPSEVVQYWLEEIRLAKKREHDYRKVGEEVFKIYEADDEQVVPFNILYSNTETLRPALLSLVPRPVVMRRHKDEDPIGKLAADAGRRMLEYLLDTNRDGYETVMEAMGACTLDALLPGRGVVTLKYDADFTPLAEPRPPDEDSTTSVDAEPVEYADHETVCAESIVWDRIYFGYAKKWHKVPWIAYEYFMTKEEVAARFGKPLAGKLTYTLAQSSGDDERRPRHSASDETTGARKTACVYQIWDKAGGKRVLYVAPSYTENLLKDEDDPLGLTGFFNTPRPLMFIEKSCSLIPTAPYKTYKNQAQELNRLTRRINKIIEAIKARGIYDGALGDQFAKIMEQDDNTLIPAEVASSLATEKGFENAIWFMPIEQLIAVLVQLYQARESCKQVIYEITGISDILRGSTQASETATAQQIKNQWGTLRLKRMQGEVARYFRDLLRMMLELAATKFSEETWAAMTGLPFVTSAQRQQLERQAQVLVSQGVPLPPPLQQQLAQPVWGQILELLKDDAARSYRIDIETNSTVEPEAAEDQKHINELLGMLGQLLNGLGPLVAKGVMPFQAVQGFLLFVVRRFRMGSEIEDYIKAMQPPKPEDDGTDADAQMQAMQKQLEMEKQQAMADVQLKQKQAEMALQERAMQVEIEQKKREMDLQMREMELQMKEQQFGIQQQVEKTTLDLHKQRAAEQIGTQQKVADLENKKYKTENVVNQKADTALGQGVKSMQELVGQLVKAVAQQAQDNQRLVDAITTTLSKPRVKKAVRGRDGRIERVEEEVMG
jgi:hypothetical protein